MKTKRIKNIDKYLFFFFAASLVLGSSILFVGCGKHEARGGTIGAISGAVIATSLANEKNKDAALVAGGVLGNYIGRKIGADTDRKKRAQKEAELEKKVEAAAEKKVAKLSEKVAVKLAEETQKLKQETNGYYPNGKKTKVKLVTLDKNKWCDTCGITVSLRGAKNCPYCGSKLLVQQVCPQCETIFKGAESYKYCPYCN